MKAKLDISSTVEGLSLSKYLGLKSSHLEQGTMLPKIIGLLIY